jgi:polyferredoxin
MAALRARALPQPLHAANEALAFLLELCMLAALAWWGATAVSALAGRVALAIICPLAAIVGWWLFAAPRARIRLPLAGVLAVKAVAFGAGTAALYAVGQHLLAIVFAVVAAVNTGVAASDRNAAMQRETALTSAGSGS